MKKTATINVYKFDSFTEILDFLRADYKNRNVRFGDREIAVFLDADGNMGDNIDTFFILDRWFDDDPEVSSLEEYFGEDGEPLDDLFAQDFDLGEFRGEEHVAEA